MQEQLNNLRTALAEVQTMLIEAEADLTDQLAEINAFEFEFEARVGHLIDKLEILESELRRYNERIQIARNKQIFGQAHISVDEQYRRAWRSPAASAPMPPTLPLTPVNEAEIKKLYRQLALRFHPDLATGAGDRAHRTRQMQAINDAYAARSLTELLTLAQVPDLITNDRAIHSDQTEAQLIKALRSELNRCQNRLRDIETELRNLPYRPSVEVSLEVKAARRQGRDLLAEMAAEFERKIARTAVERDMLKAQFDQLGPEQGFIPTDQVS